MKGRRRSSSALYTRTISTLLIAAVGSQAIGQEVAGQLQAGHMIAVRAAIRALDHPAAADIDPLLELIQQGADATGPQAVASELAFGVLGSWSLQHPAIADLLYDRIEGGKWSEIDGELHWLAVIGAARGTERALKWIERPEPEWRRRAWRLLRSVGSEGDEVPTAVRQALASEAEVDQLLGLELMWEFQLASDELTQRCEALYEASTNERIRWAVLWAMVRGGSFQTDWMLELRAQQERREDTEWLDRLFERMAAGATTRLARELPRLKESERYQVMDWLGSHVHDDALRKTLLEIGLETEQRLALLAPHFARHALGKPDLLTFWVECLRADPHTRRCACLGLAHLGELSAPHLEDIARLLDVDPDGSPVSPRLRASAIHALGALGKKARHYVDRVAGYADSKDAAVAASAHWALPRLKGQALPGPWRSRSREPRQEFAPKAMIGLRRPSSLPLRSITGWPLKVRRLAMPRLLVSLLDEQPSPPPTYRAFGGGPRPMLEQLFGPEFSNAVQHRVLYEPEKSSWRDLCALRAKALQSSGDAAAVTLTLLQWLEPRRPQLTPLVQSLSR